MHANCPHRGVTTLMQQQQQQQRQRITSLCMLTRGANFNLATVLTTACEQAHHAHGRLAPAHPWLKLKLTAAAHLLALLRRRLRIPQQQQQQTSMPMRRPLVLPSFRSCRRTRRAGMMISSGINTRRPSHHNFNMRRPSHHNFNMRLPLWRSCRLLVRTALPLGLPRPLLLFQLLPRPHPPSRPLNFILVIPLH